MTVLDGCLFLVSKGLTTHLATNPAVPRMRPRRVRRSAHFSRISVSVSKPKRRSRQYAECAAVSAAILDGGWIRPERASRPPSFPLPCFPDVGRKDICNRVACYVWGDTGTLAQRKAAFGAKEKKVTWSCCYTDASVMCHGNYLTGFDHQQRSS